MPRIASTRNGAGSRWKISARPWPRTYRAVCRPFGASGMRNSPWHPGRGHGLDARYGKVDQARCRIRYPKISFGSSHGAQSRRGTQRRSGWRSGGFRQAGTGTVSRISTIQSSSGAKGSVALKVLPPPGVPASEISPPSKWAIRRQMAKPSPLPPTSRVVVPSS